MEAQGYMIEDNILHQDNKSTILLQENGRKSAGKQLRALNVRYLFLMDQVDNILHQDNKSTILLQENGRKSTGKWSQALNVRYFFLMDEVKKGNLRITYCPTNDMTADYMTKPLHGKKFRKFQAEIMGL